MLDLIFCSLARIRAWYSSIEEEFIQKRKQRSSLLFMSQNWFNSLPHYRLSARMIWRNGWIEKWTLGGMDASEKWMIFHFTPQKNHHPPKTDVLPKYFLQIILAAKWIVRHSSIHPPNSSDDLCLLFCVNPSSMVQCPPSALPPSLSAPPALPEWWPWPDPPGQRLCYLWGRPQWPVRGQQRRPLRPFATVHLSAPPPASLEAVEPSLAELGGVAAAPMVSEAFQKNACVLQSAEWYLSPVQRNDFFKKASSFILLRRPGALISQRDCAKVFL